MIRSSGENHHKEWSDDQKREGSGRQLLVQDQIKYNNKATYNLKAWSVKDPRIVRVSRTFGGKDRHSKVRTIRGLRDRRVRLSVSTAIQLYDLQDRLGLNQPSKVVDWLIKAAQHEIDELPPLHFKQEPTDDHHPFSTDQSMMSTQMDPFAFTPSNSCIDHGGKYTNLISHSTDDDVHSAKQTKLLMEDESKDHFGSYPRFWNLEAANIRGKQAVDQEISHNLQLGSSHVSTHDQVPPSMQLHNLIQPDQSNSYPTSLVINPMSYNPFLSNSLGLQYQTQQQDQSTINGVSPSLVSASSSSGTPRLFLYQPINGGSSGSSSSSPNIPMEIINPKLHMGHSRMLRMSSDHHAATTTTDHQLMMSNTYLSSNTSPSAEAMKHHIYHSQGHYSSQSPNHTS